MAYAGEKKKLRNSLHVSHTETKVSLASTWMQGAASGANQIYNWRKCDVALLPL